jgi:uncharacterized membrane protein
MYILFYVLLCSAIAWFGRDRKLGFWGYLFASLLFTPIIGVVLLIASDKKVEAAS